MGTTLYLRSLPPDLVREAKAASARRGTTLASFVADSLGQTLHRGGRRAAGDAGLRASFAWYERHRPAMQARYAGRYVAILDEAVVDHDRDFDALASRVFARFGTRPIFMPRVQASGALARVRSPRRSAV